jgi:hypothetical protein
VPIAQIEFTEWTRNDLMALIRSTDWSEYGSRFGTMADRFSIC